MKGILLFLLGVIVGIVVLAVVQIFLVAPAPLPQSGTGPPDLIILFRNDFLTRELQRQAAGIQTPVPLQNLVVRTTPDHNLVVAGEATVPRLGVTAPVQITLHPSVRNNRVVVDVVKVSVGALTVPGQFLDAIEGPINDGLNRWIAGSQFEILAVSTTPEGLLVSVLIKGR